MVIPPPPKPQSVAAERAVPKGVVLMPPKGVVLMPPKGVVLMPPQRSASSHSSPTCVKSGTHPVIRRLACVKKEVVEKQEVEKQEVEKQEVVEQEVASAAELQEATAQVEEQYSLSP